MPKKSKTLCVDDLRHAEYYGMQDTFDELYQKSQNGEVFENLMDLILSRDNILLAYRNIKANKGSYTAGTDKKNITDIGSQTPDDVVKRVRVVRTGYEVPKNPVFMRVYGHFPNWRIGFATLLQHVMSREPFATDEITANGYAVMS